MLCHILLLFQSICLGFSSSFCPLLHNLSEKEIQKDTERKKKKTFYRVFYIKDKIFTRSYILSVILFYCFSSFVKFFFPFFPLLHNLLYIIYIERVYILSVIFFYCFSPFVKFFFLFSQFCTIYQSEREIQKERKRNEKENFL